MNLQRLWDATPATIQTAAFSCVSERAPRRRGTTGARAGTPAGSDDRRAQLLAPIPERARAGEPVRRATGDGRRSPALARAPVSVWADRASGGPRDRRAGGPRCCARLAAGQQGRDRAPGVPSSGSRPLRASGQAAPGPWCLHLGRRSTAHGREPVFARQGSSGYCRSPGESRAQQHPAGRSAYSTRPLMCSGRRG